MADVTISNLTKTVPTTAAILPFSLDNQTYSSSFAQLSSLPFIPKAFGFIKGLESPGAGNLMTLYNSYNIKSVEKQGTGLFKATFLTPMKSQNYTVSLTNSPNNNLNLVSSIGAQLPVADMLSVNYFLLYTYARADGSSQDPGYLSFVVYQA